MSSNFLTELPDEIGNLSELVQLRLGNNKLTALPTALRHLQRLQVLKFMAFELVEKASPVERQRPSFWYVYWTRLVGQVSTQ